MEKFTSCYIVQCLKPACRFRYPSSSKPGQVLCPKCGSPVQITGYENPELEKQSPDHTNGRIEILVDNVRSAYNIGSVLRTSDAVNVSHIHLCGTTPTPDNPKVKKTALGAELSIPWTQHWNALDAVNELKQKGLSIVSLELSPQSVSIYEIQPKDLRFPMVLVLGSEVTGVDPQILALSDQVVQIPMLGTKGSINVASAFGVAVYFMRYLEYKSK